MKFSALVVTTAAIIAIANVRTTAGVLDCGSIKKYPECIKHDECVWLSGKITALLLFPAFIVSEPLLL